jgi:hypothetical protein
VIAKRKTQSNAELARDLRDATDTLDLVRQRLAKVERQLEIYRTAAQVATDDLLRCRELADELVGVVMCERRAGARDVVDRYLAAFGERRKKGRRRA